MGPLVFSYSLSPSPRGLQSNLGKGGGRPSWARGGVLIGGLMAAMTLLNNAAFFSSRGQQHRYVGVHCV